MSRSSRIHLLRIACAADRLELALTVRTPTPKPAARLFDGIDPRTWIDLGASVLAPVLPRKLRLLLTIARVWTRVRRSP